MITEIYKQEIFFAIEEELFSRLEIHKETYFDERSGFITTLKYCKEKYSTDLFRVKKKYKYCGVCLSVHPYIDRDMNYISTQRALSHLLEDNPPELKAEYDKIYDELAGPYIKAFEEVS